MKLIKSATVVLVLLLFLTLPLAAQETAAKKLVYGWQKSVVGDLNLSQTSFDNWAQGGENSLAWQLNLNGKFVNDQEKFNWANSGKFTFGKTKVGKTESRKSIDEIRLESVLTYKLGTFINPYVAATAASQFAAGYNYGNNTKVAVSNFLDPAYFTQSVGIGYSPKPELKTRLGAALKETITKDHPIPYADDPKTTKIEKTKTEIGAESVTDFSKKISENSLYTTKLELFSNLKAVNQIDVRWDNLLTAKVSKYVNLNFNFLLFYDRDISKKRQLKQALALGLTYSFL